MNASPETTQLSFLRTSSPWAPLTHFTLCRTAAFHSAVGSSIAFRAGGVAFSFVQVQAFLTLCAKVSAETVLTVLNFAFDALVHVRVAHVEVAQRTGGQTDANLPDVVPLQKDEEFWGAPETPVELRAQVTPFGTALAHLCANSSLPLALQCLVAATATACDIHQT